MTDLTANTSPWTGMLPVEDTALAITDTGGTGRPIVYLNGSYASQRHWRPVIAELGSTWRHITYDERARGKSRRSADYSFEACLRDLDGVLKATKVKRPILVGWSYGAFVAVHWADRFPDRVSSVVSVDGAIPSGLVGEEGREQIRKLFRRLAWMFPIASRLGLAARMSAAQHADINIELNELAAAAAPVLIRVKVPVHYVLARGGHTGTNDEQMEQVRASLKPVLTQNPNLRVSATVTSNHEHIIRKDFRAIAQAVREAEAASNL